MKNEKCVLSSNRLSRTEHHLCVEREYWNPGNCLVNTREGKVKAAL